MKIPSLAHLIVLFAVALALPATAQDSTDLASRMQKLENVTTQSENLALLSQIQHHCTVADDLINYIQAAKKAGVALDEAGYYDAAIQAYKTADALHLFRAPVNQDEWEALGWLYVNAGFTHAWYGHFYEAKNWYEAARSIFENHSVVNTTVAAYLHRELGNIYTRFGDHKAAYVLLDKVRRVALEGGDEELAAQAMNDIAIAQADTGNDSLAVTSCQRALAMKHLSPVSICLLESTLALSLGKLGQLDLARQHALIGLAACRQVVNKNLHPSGKYWVSNLHKQLGEMSDDPSASLAHFDQALALLKLHFPDTLRREVAKVHLLIADFFLRQKDPANALRHQQSALQSVLYGFSDENPAVNPAASSFYPENSIMEALDGKARSWTLLYHQTTKTEYLKRALACYRLLFKAARVYRQGHHFEASSLAVVAELNRRTGATLDLIWELYQQEPSTTAVRQAFEFMEQSRSVLLYEALRQSEAGSFANIPDSLLQKEQQLNSQIAEVDKAIFFEKKNAEETAALKKSEAEALRLRQQLGALTSQIEQDYPAFYQLKYVPDTVGLEVAQGLLRDDQALVNYFPMKDKLYILLLRSDSAYFHQISISSDIDRQVSAFRKVIEEFQFAGADKSSLCEEYTRQAYALYQLLIAPLEADGLPENLIIVPGGMLGLLPFGALLTAIPEVSCQFKTYPYLLRNHNLTFTYSAALMKELELPRSTALKDGVAFAPAFKGAGGFGALQFNIRSANEIVALMGGKAVCGKGATRQMLEKMANASSWIYLATHAQANNQDGEFSFLALTGNGAVYDSVYARELYAMNIPAELVFLGACETGSGNWQEGEGINSLARAFFYAGARSIVTTLWSINDESNSRLTRQFFFGLKKGLPKDVALRTAQLSQIESAPQDLFAHPVYWAAYTAIGKMDPMPARKNPWLLLLVLALFVGLAVWWRSHTKRAVNGLYLYGSMP